ncbi:TSUP family transporter, partial [Acinetobacter baumannii]
ESWNAIRVAKVSGRSAARRAHAHGFLDSLPLKMRFRRSKLYTSALPPVAIGAFVGFLAAIFGIGGGFIIVPALIYLLRMPTGVVVGTSLFQLVF